MRTYTIELRADFVETEKYDLLMQAMREKAREIMAVAILMQDKRKPQISLQSGDMFERDRDLEIITPEDLERGE